MMNVSTSSPKTPTAEPGPGRAPADGRARRRRVVAGALAACVLAALTVGILVGRDGDRGQPAGQTPNDPSTVADASPPTAAELVAEMTLTQQANPRLEAAIDAVSTSW